MSDQWHVEPSGSGVLGRLLVPQSSTKPAMTAFLAGLAGTAAFVASLVLDWQRITMAAPGNRSGGGGTDELEFTGGLGNVDTLGLVYVLGALGLISMLGAVLVRPEVALRVRMAATGLGVGLVGILVAVALRLPEVIFNLQIIFGGISTQDQEEMIENSEIAYEPGMFAAFAAVVLLTGALWLAGMPAARAAAKWAAYAAEYPEAARYYSAYYYAGQPFPAAPTGSAVPVQPDRAAAGVGQTATAPAGAPAGSVTPTGTAPAPSYAPPPPPTFTSPVASTYHPPPPSHALPTTDWTRPGHVDGLSVSASEPIDPSTSPDVWRS